MIQYWSVLRGYVVIAQSPTPFNDSSTICLYRHIGYWYNEQAFYEEISSTQG